MPVAVSSGFAAGKSAAGYEGLAPEQLLSDLTAEKVELFESGEE